MKDFYVNTTSSDKIYNFSNITSNNTVYVVTCIIICIVLPLTLVAIYALYSQVQNDHVAPIYIINLLISDLIQLCCMIVWVSQCWQRMIYKIANYTYVYCLVVSVGFMVCVALERYLVIACPLWYRFRRTIKISVVVCVLVWTVPLVYFFTCRVTFDSWGHCFMPRYLFAYSTIFFLLPLPLLIFFLGGTLKALSASRVPDDEKRRVVGTLVLVLLIYTLLFLPTIIWHLAEDLNDDTFKSLSFMFVRLNPLADLALYVFMRKGTIDKLLASVCCCRMDSNDANNPSV